MFTLDLEKLTPEQRAMVGLWEEHMKAEFQDNDAHASCDTMVANPYVNHVPVLTGGVGGSFEPSAFCAFSSSSVSIFRSCSRPSRVVCFLAISSFSSSVIEARSALI